MSVRYCPYCGDPIEVPDEGDDAPPPGAVVRHDVCPRLDTGTKYRYIAEITLRREEVGRDAEAVELFRVTKAAEAGELASVSYPLGMQIGDAWQRMVIENAQLIDAEPEGGSSDSDTSGHSG